MEAFFIIIAIIVLCSCLYSCYKHPEAVLKVFVIAILGLITILITQGILYDIDPSLNRNILHIYRIYMPILTFISFYIILPSFFIYTCCKMKMSSLKSENFNHIFINFVDFRPFLARIC
jgi:hypothetical protein